ncbi:MAG: Ig-like domain-containing protein, partial [Microcoleaceae cyanobacterium]
DPLTITTVTTPANGTATINDNGTPANPSDDVVDYTPNTGFTGVDSFDYTIIDGNGGTDTATVTIDINPTPPVIPFPPTLDLDGDDSTTLGSDFATTFIAGGNAVAVGDTDVAIADSDSETMVSATVILTQRPDGNDVESLAVNGTLPAGITASEYNPETGMITLSGNATIANYQTAINQIVYNNTADLPTTQARIVSSSVNDGTTDSNIGNAIISVVPPIPPVPPVAPNLDLDGNDSATVGSDFATTFTVGGNAVAVGDSDVAITDSDSPNMVSATLTLTNRLDGNDVESLAVNGTLPAGITASEYNPETGMITLSGNATIADYQTAINQIVYNNTSENPNTEARIVSTTVNDGTTDSNIANGVISVNFGNTKPDAEDDVEITQPNIPVNINVLNNDTDPEGSLLTITEISSPGNGTAIIDDNGTPDDKSDDQITYTPNTDFTGVDTFTYSITDGNGGTDTANVTVGIAEPIIIAEPVPTPVPVPVPTPEPVPVPVPVPTPEPVPVPVPVPVPTPEPVPVPVPVPTPGAEPVPVPTPEPVPVPVPVPTPGAEPVPVPVPVPTPGAEPVPVPVPVPTPGAEPVPEPTPGADEDACGCPPIPEFEGIALPQRVEIDANVPPDAIFRTDGDDSDDVMMGTGENDIIRGALGSDTIEGAGGDDSLYGGVDDNFEAALTRDTDNPLVRDVSGRDAIDGAGGNDFISANESNDTVMGSDGNDTAYGGKDDDLMFGDDGNDVLYGDMGNDTVIGGNGKNGAIVLREDQIAVEDNDMLYGYRNDDVLVGGPGNDMIFAGKDRDFAFGGEGDDAIWGDLGADTVYGDKGNDTLYGDTNDPQQTEINGSDFMWGGSGDDLMNGNQGEDTLSGGMGNDIVRGGQQNDLLFGDIGNDMLYGEQGNDMLCGNEGDDTLFGDELGQVGNDTLCGGSGNDLLFGNQAEDILCGQMGNDTLHGGLAADTLKGGPGDDWLFGDEGSDLITTGSGSDRIVLFSMNNSTDTITDFTVGEDIILLGGGSGFNEISFTASGTSTIITANGQELAIVEQITPNALNDVNNFATF